MKGAMKAKKRSKRSVSKTKKTSARKSKATVVRKARQAKRPSKKRAAQSPVKTTVPTGKGQKAVPVQTQTKVETTPSPAPPVQAGTEIGQVIGFFRIPVVAVVSISQGRLKLGDRIWIRGHTTDLKETVTSMQINHQPIQEAKAGDEIGLKVSDRVRRGDRVYLLSA
jgi:putative protease